MKSNTMFTITAALGNLAVLAGLVFLTIELRQNSAIALSQIRQERSNAMIQEFSQIYSDSAVLALHSKLKAGDYESITGLEKERLFWFERVRYQRFEDVFFQYRNGLMDEAPYAESMKFAADRKRLWEWVEIPMHNKEMNREVSRLLSSPEYTPSQLSIRFAAWRERSQ